MDFLLAILGVLAIGSFVAFMLWIWDGWITPSIGWILLFAGIGVLFWLFSALIVIAAVFVVAALTAFVLSGID